MHPYLTTILGFVLGLGIHLAVIMRVLLRPHRDPASRIAWVVVTVSLPVLGITAYLLFGEVNIGRRRIERARAVLEHLPNPRQAPGRDAPHLQAMVPERHRHLFRVGLSISGLEAVGGNRGQLLKDSEAVIDSLVEDIDSAADHVHLLFYIWLPDNSGRRVAEALIRAAGRGVTCRALADDLGSRLMIRSEHWQRMQSAGVRLGRALPIGNPLLRALHGRIDLRNHRKIVVIDDRITYCGSQNCADAAFAIKPRFAPWIDAMMRFEGPVARQNQYLFAGDWMAHVDDDLGPLLRSPVQPYEQGLTAQAFGTGPTVRWSAMPEMFETLIFSARRELVITTPYYVPDESLQGALCACAYRGVDTTIVFPARNDSWIVGAASHSYYSELLAAGVHIHEYLGGLLHTKSLTLDGEITLIGSANMDRRSFDLNYENNILLYDPALTAEMRRRQQSYIEHARRVTPEEVGAWGWPRRLWNNTVAVLGPVL